MPSMHELARRNRLNTWILIAIFVPVLVLLGVALGAASGMSVKSALVGAAVAAPDRPSRLRPLSKRPAHRSAPASSRYGAVP